MIHVEHSEAFLLFWPLSQLLITRTKGKRGQESHFNSCGLWILEAAWPIHYKQNHWYLLLLLSSKWRETKWYANNVFLNWIWPDDYLYCTFKWRAVMHEHLWLIAGGAEIWTPRFMMAIWCLNKLATGCAHFLVNKSMILQILNYSVSADRADSERVFLGPSY